MRILWMLTLATLVGTTALHADDDEGWKRRARHHRRHGWQCVHPGRETRRVWVPRGHVHRRYVCPEPVEIETYRVPVYLPPPPPPPPPPVGIQLWFGF